MANRQRRLTANVAGNFYVDATCINCDTCRQLAPETFEEVGGSSAVVQQPQEAPREIEAYRALLACPVGAIGTEHGDPALLRIARAGFPLPLEDSLYSCGFNSAKSFGANSFFIRHPDGNWLIDSPRFVKHLVEAFERMGGLSFIFLTHEDDVADADRYAAHFGARRIIHRADAQAVPDAEWILEGSETIRLAADFQAIPVPGHTPGSHALLYGRRVLFTGDHLWWEPRMNGFDGPRRLVWDRAALLHSLERLCRHRFEWVLPGHGHGVRLPDDEMQRHLRALVHRRKAALVS